MSRQTIEKIEEAVTHTGVGEGCVAYFVRNISDLSGIITLGNQKPNKSLFFTSPFLWNLHQYLGWGDVT